MVQLKEKNKDNSILVSELRDGQIGIITEWGDKERYIGQIVQKFKEYIISVGETSGNNWSPIPLEHYCRVQVLKEGTELIITNNQ